MRVDLLERFAALVGASRSPVPLLHAALAYSAALQDGDTWPAAAAELATLEQQCMDHCAERFGELAVAEGVLEFMRTQGFVGDREHYEAVANSLMDRVLERRRGLPITLSVLAIHLGERCGIRIEGIGFPGHFLVGMQLDSEQPIIWDPFRAGMRVGFASLASLFTSVVGQQIEPDAPQLRAHVAPAHSRLILTRMLENLRRHYTIAGERHRIADVLELLAILHPEVPRIRELLDEEPCRRRDLLN
jgi:regulator of sirC expression with transglutaminase-like and TPR domain